VCPTVTTESLPSVGQLDAAWNPNGRVRAVLCGADPVEPMIAMTPSVRISLVMLDWKDESDLNFSGSLAARVPDFAL
jgi:hypothetical protein